MSSVSNYGLSDEDILRVGSGATLTLSSPHTKGWVRIKEGYLLKLKSSKKSLLKKGKLRYFVLLQQPITKQAQLEYYTGRTFRGSANLAYARAFPMPDECLEVHTPTKVLKLQAEAEDPDAAATWTFALQKAIDECKAAQDGHENDYGGETKSYL